MSIIVYRLAAISVMVTFGLLGLFVFLQNTRSKLYRASFFFSLFVVLWTLGFFLTMFPSFPHYLALFFSRISHSFGVIIPVAFFRYALALVGEKRKLALRLNYIFTILLSMGYIVTPWFIVDVERKFNFPYYPVAGPLYIVFIIYWTYLAVYSHYLLYRDYKKTNDRRRQQQIKYFFMGQILAWSGAALLFPLIFGIQIDPITYVLLPMYSILTTYAILRHQLMDIEVVIRRTLQFAGLVGFAAFFMAILPKYLLELFGIPRVVADVGGAIIIAAFFGQVRDWLVNVTDRFLFQKKYDFRELMRGFTDELTTVLDLKRLIQMTMETLTDTVKLENCSLLLLNKDTRKYELAGSKGANGKQIVLEEQEPFIAFLRETHEPIVRKGPLAKVRYPEVIVERTDQLNAFVCLPLHIHEDLIGVLCLGKKKSDEDFTKDDLDDLLALAKTLSIGITNSQQLDELTKTQAKAAQSEKLAVIGTLSAGINHEICNPLGIVKAQCEAFLLDLEDGILIGKSSQDLLDRMSTIMRGALKQIDRATAITQKLSNFAKPIKDAAAQPVSVAQEVDEVLLLVGHDLKLEKIEVIKEIQPDLPQIVVDRRQFQEVLFNLARNAGQAIKPPGTIWVRAHTEGGNQVRIEIADTGSGIPPDKLEKIYDPFFTTKDPGKGTGLGLFIVRQIVERNKGRISVESTVGKGTTFFLDFSVLRPSGIQPVLARS